MQTNCGRAIQIKAIDQWAACRSKRVQMVKSNGAGYGGNDGVAYIYI